MSSVASAPPPRLSNQDSTSLLPNKLARSRPLFDPEIVRRAILDSFRKLNPFTLAKNPVMFVVEVGAALVTLFLLRDAFSKAQGSLAFELQISLWLWFTVLFANFAEAMAEARGKAQADTLRKTKTDSIAKRLLSSGKVETISGSKLRAGDIVIAEAGDIIAGDGEVIEGIARLTNPSSPAKARPSSASRAAIAALLPAAPVCSPIRSRSASPPIPARRFSTR